MVDAWLSSAIAWADRASSWFVLVSLLRGERVVLDTGASDAYAQVVEPDGSVIDLLGVARTNHVAGVHLPPDPLPPWMPGPTDVSICCLLPPEFATRLARRE